jgi:hypothetical protein
VACRNGPGHPQQVGEEDVTASDHASIAGSVPSARYGSEFPQGRFRYSAIRELSASSDSLHQGAMLDPQTRFRIEEYGTDRYPSLEAARQAAMPILAQLLANTIQCGLDSGRYFVENGIVKLSKEERACEQLPAAQRRPGLGILP